MLILDKYFSVPSSSADETKAIVDKLNKIEEQLKAGADFKQLAIANSDDQSALDGGDLGWRKMAQLGKSVY